MFKQKLYEIIAETGVMVLSKLFPESFACSGVKPSDRYIEYNFALRHLPKPPAKILDVGVTSSYFPLILAGFGYDVTGIDMRDYQIAEKITFPNFKFLKCDISNNIVMPQYFDCVTAISTIEHIGVYGRYGAKKDEYADFHSMANIRFNMKNNGTLILTIPVGKYKVIAPFQRVYDWERIKMLTSGFKLNEQKYYVIDKSGFWVKCSSSYAFSISPTKKDYAIGMYKFTKED